MRRYPVWVAALVLPWVAACQGGDQTTVPDSGLDYVAIGDSFTAAPGIPKISNRDCQQSDHNYPHLVAMQLEDVTLTDVSCGGSRTTAVLKSQVHESTGRVQPPQISALSETTDVVTVGLGVNDLDFAVTAVLACVLLAEHDPDGAPCKDRYGQQVAHQLRSIEARVADTIEAIANRAPKARILLVGYPRLLPESGSCPQRFPLSQGDIAYVRDSFNGMIDSIASAAEQTDAEYVDVAAASDGHDICSDEPWINGQHETEGMGAAFHPTPAEQQAVARLILQHLRGARSPDTA